MAHGLKKFHKPTSRDKAEVAQAASEGKGYHLEQACFQTGYHFGETRRKDTGNNIYSDESNWTALAKKNPTAARRHDYKMHSIAGAMNSAVDKVLSANQLAAEAAKLVKDGNTWAMRRMAEKQAVKEAEEPAAAEAEEQAAAEAEKQGEPSRRKRRRINKPFPVNKLEGRKLLSMQTVICPRGSSQHYDKMDGLDITACGIREAGGCGECHIEQVRVCDCRSGERMQPHCTHMPA